MMHRASIGRRAPSEIRSPSQRKTAQFALSLPLLVLGGVLCGFLCGAAPATAATVTGFQMFPASNLSSNTVTGEKPQSKLWFHDGSWWAILRGPDGVAFYEKVGDEWVRSVFVDAVLASLGTADVKWTGERLLVLVYSGSPKYFEYTYDASLRVWNLVSGFPVGVPKPSGSETMVLEQDSSGRAWIAVEGNNNILAYYTTSADRRTWSATPVTLRTGVGSDDICSIVAFAADRIGVFWSDQNRDEFGFDVHRDGDAPANWQPLEIVDSGAGYADDHINLAFDSTGRVYAITKDDFDRMTVHRRETNGQWTHQRDVTGGIGTRGILMVAEADNLAYILWTDWTKSPDRIEYRTASLNDLMFGTSTTLMNTPAGSLNNVSGTKQELPHGTLMAVAEGAGAVWWNGWGVPVEGNLPPPAAPGDFVATLRDSLQRVDLSWSPPATGIPDGYYVYRQIDSGAFERLNASLWTTTAYVDSALAGGQLCYKVTAFANHQEGEASNPACVSYTPPTTPPPGAPVAVTATAGEATLAAGAAAYALDEGSGQVVHDATGNGNDGQLGSKSTSDSYDPLWSTGVSGTALRFDGSNDRVIVPDAPELDFAGSFTIEAWLRLTNLGTGDCVVAKGEASRRNFWMEIDTSSRIDFRWETSGGTKHGAVTPTAAIADLEWHHLACVYDQAAGEDRIYRDGVLLYRAADRGTPVVNSDPLYIGAKTTSGKIKSVVNGDVDQVRVSPGIRYTADFVPAAGFDDAQPHAYVQIAWAPPQTGTAASYRVYRQAEDGSFVKLGECPATTTSWTDLAPPAGTACYRVSAVDALGQEGTPSDIACASAPVMAKASPAVPESPVPSGTELVAAPNPFNPTTTIRFRLAEPSRVHCAVYDVSGRLVATLVEGTESAGEHAVSWNAGREVPSGIYFLVLDTGTERLGRKLVLAK